MSDSDKTRRGKGAAGKPDAELADDRTVFRKGDATRRAQVSPPSREATVVRRRDADNKVPEAAPAGGDATQIRPVPDDTRRPQPQPPGQTRSPPAVQPGPGASPGIHGVEEHQVLKGRFTLEKVIGVGGMGVVYKALDRLKVEAHDREPYVAIKVLSEEFKAHPESFIALQRESRKTQRIAHPNVVKVFDFDRDGDIVFMTMEYMEGRPLDDLIRQYSATGLPPDDVWNILNGLCSALIHAHEEHIVHSDFKPGNIFITDSGMPKIFDFGIARAVANVDRQSGKTRDVTVFDAGSLGALTPAYASLEMLLGQQPDVRDDLYALGCIAYEILTGEHPFNRLPADEALKRGLKPRKITGIKRRQWRAIEKALAFKREDRLSSVREFHEEILSKAKPSYVLGAALSIILAISLATYIIVTIKSAPQDQSYLQLDEIEFGIRYNLFKEKLEKLLRDPVFSEAWEGDLWEEYSGLKTLLADRKDKWFASTTEQIYQLYVKVYGEHLGKREYRRASALLANAYRYATDTDYLDAEKAKLAALMLEMSTKLKAQEEDRARATEARQGGVKEEPKATSAFDVALRNVNQQLRCESNLSMRDFAVAIDKLRSTDAARYQRTEPNIVASLTGCIIKIGNTQPERAMEAKSYAQRIFPGNSVIAGINIRARESCDKSLAGLGARGDAAICRDRMHAGTQGPALVVIPASGALPAFAIGKYEVSVREFNQFCNATKACTPQGGVDDGLPATNLRVETAIEFTRWLSRGTQQRYRLPSRAEWVHAANATGRSHDPNRNCAFSTRGIEKGGQLVRVNAGAQNGWGLVNYLGNSQEWVYDQGRSLVAVGGSFHDSMVNCTVDSVTSHSGGADGKTGFRVVREVAR